MLVINKMMKDYPFNRGSKRLPVFAFCQQCRPMMMFSKQSILLIKQLSVNELRSVAERCHKIADIYSMLPEDSDEEEPTIYNPLDEDDGWNYEYDPPRRKATVTLEELDYELDHIHDEDDETVFP